MIRANFSLLPFVLFAALAGLVSPAKAEVNCLAGYVKDGEYCVVRGYADGKDDSENGGISYSYKASSQNNAFLRNCMRSGGMPVEGGDNPSCKAKDGAVTHRDSSAAQAKSNSTENADDAYTCSQSLDDIGCDGAVQTAQMACESPAKTEVSASAAVQLQGTGISTGDLFNLIGGVGGTVLQAKNATDPVAQCETTKKVAGILEKLQTAYGLSCTAAFANCTLQCNNALSSLNEISKCKTWSGDQTELSKRKRAVSAYINQCQRYVANIQQAGMNVAAYMTQAKQAGDCSKLTNIGLTNPDCTNAQYAATYPDICKPAAVADCSGANASSTLCICRTNPLDSRCTGREISSSDNTKAGLGGLPSLGNTNGVDFSAPIDPSKAIGGTSTGGGGGGGAGLGASSLSGGGGENPGKGGSGANADIERGFRTGGGSAGVTGGGYNNGNSNGGGNGRADQFNLSKYMPGGRGQDAFRSKAGMETTGVDGITCANCTPIFVKINNGYSRLRPTLRP